MFRMAVLFLGVAFAIALVQAPRAQSPQSAPPGKAAIHDVAAQKNYGKSSATSLRKNCRIRFW